MIAMMQQKKQAPNQQQRGNAASSKTSSALQAALSQSYERPAEMKRRYVRPSMPTARYTSEEALVEGRFPYVPRRRGVKPNPGAHSDALVMRSMESARSLNAAVGNAEVLAARPHGGESYTSDGSRVCYYHDGSRVAVRADGSTVVETPYEHPVLFAPSGREDLLGCFRVAGHRQL